MAAEESIQAELESIGRQVPAEALGAVRRIMASVATELASMDRRELAHLVGLTDAELLAQLAEQAIEREPLRYTRLSRMRLKGARRFMALIQAHGGAYTAQESAELMATSIDAVKKAAQRRRLLAFKQQGQWRFPVWQFTTRGEVLPGLTRILKALPAGIGERDAVRFFFVQEERDAPNALELLQAGSEADIERAERMATRYLEQVAA